MLEVKDLRVHFITAAPDRMAVDGISFTLPDGGIMGIVGESGSGKTVTAMAITGLLPPNQTICSGSILLNGQDIMTMDDKELRKLQGNEFNVVFQEPMISFDPCKRIGHQVEEALRVHHKEMSAEERKEAALKAMTDAELTDVERVYRAYPHELSGGMLQRAMIAAAIVSKPDLLICDEPTTALDVTIQAQILKLLKRINTNKHISILFISHNLNVVRKLCDTVIVMHRGKIVEQGSAEDIFNNPQHEYTKHLVAAIPARTKSLRRKEDAE